MGVKGYSLVCVREETYQTYHLYSMLISHLTDFNKIGMKILVEKCICDPVYKCSVSMYGFWILNLAERFAAVTIWWTDNNYFGSIFVHL